MPSKLRHTKQHSADVSTPADTWLYSPVSKAHDAISIAWAYPADTAISLSSLGYLALFKEMDTNPKLAPVRITTDTIAKFKGQSFQYIGFSFSFELDILNILATLEGLGVPLLAKDRIEGKHPIVFGGGPVPTTNPEPYADFFDFFLVGDGEGFFDELASAHQAVPSADTNAPYHRNELLTHLVTSVVGVYVPSFYSVTYEGVDGPVLSVQPSQPNIPAVIERRSAMNNQTVLTSPILSENTIFSNRFLVEVIRGCPHRCRFCLASYSTLPSRTPELEPIIQAIETGLKHTNNIGLLGALIAAHPNFNELCQWLDNAIEHHGGLSISAASLRADTLIPSIANTFKKGGQKQLTVAIETGSQSLRKRINKHLPEEAIFRATSAVFEAGMTGLKLYGVTGLPDETEDDVMATVDLLKRLKKAHPRLRLTWGTSSFVPKAATPFQWQPRLDNKTIQTRFRLLKKHAFKYANITVTSPKWDWLQALFSRGDRRLAPMIMAYYQAGGHQSGGWTAFKQAAKQYRGQLPEPDWYATREREEDEVLPWEHIQLGVPKSILWTEGLAPVRQ